MRSRRRVSAVALGVLLALVGGVVWLGGARERAPSGPAATTVPPTPTPAAESAAGVPAPTAPAPPSAAAAAAAPDRSRPAPASLGQRAAESYRQRARFPHSSHPLADDEADPIARDREVSAVKARGPNGDEPTLYVFPLQTGFESPEPVTLFAYLAIRDNPVPASEIRGTVTTEDGRALGEVEYRDDGTNGDPLAGDRVYAVTFTPPMEAAAPLAASYLVRVRAVTVGGDDRLAASSFLYSNPHGRLTGRYRDTVVAGSLLVEAEVEVFAAGRFHIEGTLYDQGGGRKLLWAQSAAMLEAGTAWMPLSFYGLGLREAGVDGPYLLRYVALSTTTEMPNAKNRVAEWAHVTQGYRAIQFSDRPFDDPELLDAAKRLEADGFKGALEAGG